MLCHICGKRQATVHLTEIVNDQMTELHLCEQCAKEKGIAGLGASFGLQDLLAGLVDFASPIQGSKKKIGACANCKMTYADFRKIGRLGCSECYSAFEESLEPLLKKIHGAVRHIGKAPLHSGGQFKLKNELQALQLKLQKVVQAEAFEEAAKIRDKIKALEKKK
ncbi:MAG: hypothetical protein DRP78_04740 [Candidatus Omnitrophota bacterium]|nr:MAG: hypothetical protein DRP78_04740 [Candidatus Omnitrophota bacterium]